MRSSSLRFLYFAVGTCALVLYWTVEIVFAADRSPRVEALDRKISAISADDLARVPGRVVWIDPRPALEREPLHVARSIHLPPSALRPRELEAIIERHPDAALVFHGSDSGSESTWNAARRAVEWGFAPVFVLEDGIVEWARSHPEDVVHFGAALSEETIDKTIIRASDHRGRSVDLRRLTELVRSGRYSVYDVREARDRARDKLVIPGLIHVPIDRAIRFLEKGAVFPESNLLFLDEDGQSVRWLDYWLRRHGKRDYLFLEGGLRRWREGEREKATPATSEPVSASDSIPAQPAEVSDAEVEPESNIEIPAAGEPIIGAAGPARAEDSGVAKSGAPASESEILASARADAAKVEDDASA
ncbi:MAG TPA: rhodanese-like domain-containing protein, partial [Planctomycetota bacterium]|nr:rhodanese-like domain-containing protein [Planctomycetota bacterium]